MTKDDLANCFGGRIREALACADFDMNRITELRLRAGRQAVLVSGRAEIPLGVAADERDIAEALEIMSNHSLYAYADELKNGYLTIPGGHRLGICGQAVLENGSVKTIKNIASLNLRIAHEVKGCAASVIDRIALPVLRHTMIISPPGCGKTTLLRDIVRCLSVGFPGFPGVSVGVADERSELCGCYKGRPQLDVGPRTDVIDAAPKGEGMMILLRAMSPRVIAVDEIGRKSDAEAIREITGAGVCVICTAHGNGIDDIKRRPYLSELVRQGVFGLYITLGYDGRAGVIQSITEGSEINVD